MSLTAFSLQLLLFVSSDGAHAPILAITLCAGAEWAYTAVVKWQVILQAAAVRASIGCSSKFPQHRCVIRACTLTKTDHYQRFTAENLLSFSKINGGSKELQALTKSASAMFASVNDSSSGKEFACAANGNGRR